MAGVLAAPSSRGARAWSPSYGGREDLDITDLDGVVAEAEDAVAVGFAATACIPPSHVPVIRAAYAPSPAEVEDARRIVVADS